MSELVSACDALLKAVMVSAEHKMKPAECERLCYLSNARLKQLKMLNASNQRKMIDYLKKEIREKGRDLDEFASFGSACDFLSILKINVNVPDDIVDSEVRTSLKSLIAVLD